MEEESLVNNSSQMKETKKRMNGDDATQPLEE
jgi:hypothetical protein